MEGVARIPEVARLELEVDLPAEEEPGLLRLIVIARIEELGEEMPENLEPLALLLVRKPDREIVPRLAEAGIVSFSRTNFKP